MGSFVLALLAELVAPSRCAACDSDVPRRVLFCPACAVSAMVPGRQPPGQYAVLAYGGAIATAITRFKYEGRSDLAVPLGALMGDAALRRGLGDAGSLVVPVPLHPKRRVERGFDQAALLAWPVARRLGARCGAGFLERTRETPKQASLDRAARAANVARAFRCARPREVEGARVLLVDDVRTTGATLAACRAALDLAGARSVTTLVLASRDRDDEPA